jgi:predicted dehydrogenase
MSRLGVAVVGLGVGEAHARTFASLPSCELRWLCDLDEARAQSLAGSLAQGRASVAFDDVLRDAQVDIVSIASYDDAHARQITAALSAGKHVFVEKPLSRTLDEVRVVKQAWLRSSCHLESNLVLRAAPLYTWLKDAIANNVLGEIYAFDGDYLYGRLHKITDGWRKDVESYSAMMGGGIHLVDLMMWLTGERPLRVAAAGNNISTRGTAFRYRDFSAATFEFQSGLVGRVTANFGCVHRHQHVVRVFGTKATFIVDDSGPRLHESRNPETEPRVIPHAPVAASKGDLIPAFVEGVLAGRRRDTDTAREFDVVSACVAADSAADSGRAMDITYV